MKCLTPRIYPLALGLPSAVWAQSGKPMSIAQLAAYNKPDREQVLYAGAKTEGKITWYTSLAGARIKTWLRLLKLNIPASKWNPIAGRVKSWEQEFWRKPRPSDISSTPLRVPSRC